MSEPKKMLRVRSASETTTTQDGNHEHGWQGREEDHHMNRIKSESAIRSRDRDNKDAVVKLPDKPHREGAVLKKCRRNGDDRPWKRRWFMLYSASLIYHHEQTKADAPRRFVDVSGARVEACDAPSGFGVAIRRPDHPRSFCFAVRSRKERDAWLAALTESTHLPPVDLPEEEADGRPPPSGMYRLKSAVASAFATSSLGKHLIRRYLDQSARTLIAAVLDFTEAEADRAVRSKMETYIFDVASRIAVIVHQNTMPANLDSSTLFDETITFCQLYVRYSRDRRLAKERQLAVQLSAPSERDAAARHAVISDVDTRELLRAIAYVTAVWRSILQHNVSDKTLDRFDFVVEHLLQEQRVLSIFEDVKHRQRMVTIEQCLRELMEIY